MSATAAVEDGDGAEEKKDGELVRSGVGSEKTSDSGSGVSHSSFSSRSSGATLNSSSGDIDDINNAESKCVEPVYRHELAEGIAPGRSVMIDKYADSLRAPQGADPTLDPGMDVSMDNGDTPLIPHAQSGQPGPLPLSSQPRPLTPSSQPNTDNAHSALDNAPISPNGSNRQHTGETLPFVVDDYERAAMKQSSDRNSFALKMEERRLRTEASIQMERDK
jgi:hypothetical protein